MKRNVVNQIALAALILSSSCFAGVERDSGGGGGPRVNSQYMTFYKAGLYTEPNPVQKPVDVPGLDRFVEIVKGVQYWSAEDQQRLIATALPSNFHQYYRAKEDQFDEKTKKALLEELSQVTGQPVENLKLYAITDKDKHITYLLPLFYQLKTSDDQAAILFHENYWLLKPKVDYNTVVHAEMAFQAVGEQPKNLDRVGDLLNYYGDELSKVKVMIQSDLETKAMDGLQEYRSIRMKKLFGMDGLGCTMSNPDHNQKRTATCHRMIQVHLYSLTQKYPCSLFLQYLYGKFSTGNVYAEFNRTQLSREWELPDAIFSLTFRDEKIDSSNSVEFSIFVPMESNPWVTWATYSEEK